MKVQIYKLARIIGRRGAFLLFLSLLDLIYGFSLAFPGKAVSNPIYIYLASIAPIGMWSVLWTAVGIICLVFAFKEKDAIAFTAAMFIKVLWALLFLFGWFFAGVDRGYLSTAIWGSFAAVLALVSTWPDPLKHELDDELKGLEADDV
jgi:hypothetical protein